MKKTMLILSIVLAISFFITDPVFADDLVIVEGLDQLGDLYFVDFGQVCQGATATPRKLVFKLKKTDGSFIYSGNLIIFNPPKFGFTAEIGVGKDAVITLPGYWSTGTLSDDTATGFVNLTAGEKLGLIRSSVQFRIYESSHTSDLTVDLIARVIKCYSIDGFYKPVDMDGVWNTVKGGSTVPLKFNIIDTFSSEAVSSTDWATLGFNFTFSQIPCESGESDEEPIEETPTGGTSLRYDFDDGNYVYNWQTPKTKLCYKATITLPGDSISAFFKLK